MTQVTLTTNMGVITIELDTENTPETSKNFLNYVEQNFFDNTLFHRVIDGFMIQGGGFDTNFQQKETDSPIKNEANLGGSNLIGTIAMARTSDPHSASSQFFINVADNKFLDFKNKNEEGWGYCVFGKVTEGLETVKQISKVNTVNRGGHQDVPERDIVLEKAEIKAMCPAE